MRNLPFLLRERMSPFFSAILPSLLALGILQGCLYTGHHFNTGQLLKSGETHWEIGIGHQGISERSCSEVTTQEIFNRLKQQNPGPNVEGNMWQDRGYSRLTTDANGKTVCSVDWYAGFDTVEQKTVSFSEEFDIEILSRQLPSASFGWRLGVRNEWGPITRGFNRASHFGIRCPIWLAQADT
jgi:hypothetical protein